MKKFHSIITYQYPDSTYINQVTINHVLLYYALDYPTAVFCKTIILCFMQPVSRKYKICNLSLLVFDLIYLVFKDCAYIHKIFHCVA